MLVCYLYAKKGHRERCSFLQIFRLINGIIEENYGERVFGEKKG